MRRLWCRRTPSARSFARSPSSPHPPFTQYPFPPHLLVRDGQTSPLNSRLVVSHSTCPPPSPSPHANSFGIGPAVINKNTSPPRPRGPAAPDRRTQAPAPLHLATCHPSTWPMMRSTMTLAVFPALLNEGSALSLPSSSPSPSSTSSPFSCSLRRRRSNSCEAAWEPRYVCYFLRSLFAPLQVY